MEFDVDRGEEKGGTAGKRRERERAEEREKKIEEGSEMRANQNKNSETASENLMDDRSRKWMGGETGERRKRGGQNGRTDKG